MEQQSSQNNKTLMIVDDDTFLLNIYATRLAKNGFAVSQYADPTVALEKMRGGFIPDVLIVDVIMPALSGLDLLEKVRSEKILPATTTVIVLTNQSDSAERNRGQSLGIDGYIIKATSIPSEVVDTVIMLSKKHQVK